MTGGPNRVLIVDDSEINRDMLSRRLARRGFSVAVACDGREALDLIARVPLDAILLDVMMPGVDGWQVLERVRACHSAADLPVIMVTARDRTDDLVRALELGANDYVTKPLDFQIVLARLQTHISLKRAKQALETTHARMKKDLDAAARLQQALMPRALPPLEHVRCAWKFRPCTELAGDILDIVPLDDRTLGIYLLDVAGHGLPAALLSVTLSRILSHMADGSSPLRDLDQTSGAFRPAFPRDVAERLNSRFQMDGDTNQYFTFLYGVLDVDTYQFRYVTAGHPGPVFLPSDDAPALLDGEDFAIGWFPHCAYDDHVLQLRPGDRLFFYSDGVVETKNPDGEMFDPARMVDVLAGTRTQPLDESLTALVDRVMAWCGDAGPDDDISLVGLEIC